jgi:hypothetical protein
MRSCWLILLGALTAWAPRVDADLASWKDVPALVAAATAHVDPALRACVKKLPLTIALIASRARGATHVMMPMPPVGIRGLTPQERCLLKTAATILVPPLPAEIERVVFGHTIGGTVAAADQATEDWRDPEATLATVIDAKRRTALAACDAKPRTVRIIFDRGTRATRIWIPAWQFHSAARDGTTPPAQRRVKACITKAIRDWRAPALPESIGELQLAIPVAP